MDDDYDVSSVPPRVEHRPRHARRMDQGPMGDGPRPHPHRVHARPARRVVQRPRQLRRRRNALVDATIVTGTLAFLAVVGYIGMLIVHASLAQ
jgi:hypothetical protein